jgi:hypothetical protein
MPSSGMLRCVANGRTDVSYGGTITRIIRVRRIGELGTTLEIISNRSTLRRNTIYKILSIAVLRSLLRLLVTASVVPSSPVLVMLMMEAIHTSETSVFTRVTWHNISEDGILRSHCHGNLKPYIALTGWTLQRRCSVSPVRYELGFYIPEDGILHNHRRENLISYIIRTGWTVAETQCVKL